MNNQIKAAIEKLLKEPGMHPKTKNVLIKLFGDCGGDVTTLTTCIDPKQYWNGTACVDKVGDGDPDPNG